jgi:hypothetical protein
MEHNAQSLTDRAMLVRWAQTAMQAYSIILILAVLLTIAEY